MIIYRSTHTSRVVEAVIDLGDDFEGQRLFRALEPASARR
jgi:hypothetical protein